jgi:hypothetical protein
VGDCTSLPFYLAGALSLKSHVAFSGVLLLFALLLVIVVLVPLIVLVVVIFKSLQHGVVEVVASEK